MYAGPLHGSSYLDRPVSVRLCDAQVNESGHRQAHIQPVTEAEVVDELKHILHAQEDQTHHALQTATNPVLINAHLDTWLISHTKKAANHNSSPLHINLRVHSIFFFSLQFIFTIKDMSSTC